MSHQPQLHNQLKILLASHVKRHLQAAVNSLRQFSRTPINSVMTCVVIGIALALPLALFVLLKNVETISHHLKQSNQLTIYLKSSATENDANHLLQQFKRNSAIADATIISPQQGLHELQQQAGLSSLAEDLGDNPLPWAIVVTPDVSAVSPENLKALSQMLSALPEVETAQIDTQWTDRLFALLSLGHRFLYALSLFLGIGIFLIVNNCIRSATQSNKKEIDIIKFIGGTNAFVRRPFLYAGMIYGLFGAIIAWQLVDLLLVWLRDPAHQLSHLYQVPMQLLDISFGDTFLLLFSSMALGVVGAWFAVSRHMRTISS